MWLKTALIYFLIVLDVMIFPFSCTGSQKKNECIFEINIYDEEHELNRFDQDVKKIPKDKIISVPENLVLVDEDYEIIGWYIYRHQDTSAEDFVPELVSFPYEVQEEDYLSYYCGHRSCVVFIAVWEYTGNASN